MADIFLSYASGDKDRVRPLVEILEQRNWSVWWDVKILPGKRFDDVIKTQLRTAKCVVVVWSAKSVESHWVKEEALDGANRAILVPILLDEVEIPFGFRFFDCARLIGWNGTAGDEELALALQSISNLMEAPRQQPEDAVPSHARPAPARSGAKKKKAPGGPRRKQNSQASGPDTSPAWTIPRPPPHSRRPIGFGTQSTAGRSGILGDWLASPEYKKFQAQRAAAQKEADKQKEAFFRSKVWLFSLAFWPLLCVAGLQLGDYLAAIVFGRWGWYPIPVHWLTLPAAGVAWGLAYTYAGVATSFRWWHLLAPPFLPYSDLWDAVDTEDFSRGLLAAWPLNSLVTVFAARGLAHAASLYLAQFEDFTNSWGLTMYGAAFYLVFWLLTITGLVRYLLDVDLYDPMYEP